MGSLIWGTHQRGGSNRDYPSQPPPPPKGSWGCPSMADGRTSQKAPAGWMQGSHTSRASWALAGPWYGWVITGDFVDVCCLVVAQTFTNNFTANEFIVYNILIPLTKFVFLGGCPHRLSWCMSHIANYYGFRKWPQHGRKCAYRQFWILKEGT